MNQPSFTSDSTTTRQRNRTVPASEMADRPSQPLQAARSRIGFVDWLTIIALGCFLVAALFPIWWSVRDLGWTSGPNAALITPLVHDGSSNNVAATHGHPLEPALAFARQIKKYMEENVHDYTATVIKQERFAGVLKPEEICYVKIRNQPFSAYMDFLSPASLAGQEAMYVEGSHDSQLIGHAGSGAMALLGSKWLPPRGPIAMFGQRYPITELGIVNLAQRLIEVGEKDMQLGECYVWRNENAKVGGRPCISITVEHPVKRPGFLFHIARIFVDKELQVPVHYEAYDWPEKPGDPPPLLESYTYTNLKLNPGLTDADFDPNNPDYHFVSK